MKKLIILIALLLPVAAFGQGWERTYGGTSSDGAYSVQQTPDGGYIIAGHTSSFGTGYSDVYLIKTDINGNTLWTKTYGGDSTDKAYSVQQTMDEGYIIAGRTLSFGAEYEDVYLIKTDINGDTLWTRIYGGASFDAAYSVQQTVDGGYIIAGNTHSFGAGNSDVYLIKTDANGDTLWTKTYGGADYDRAYSVQQTVDGGYIFAGETASFGAGSGDVYLIKTDANGDTLWTKTYGGSDYDKAYSIQPTGDGGYIIAGLTVSFGGVYLIKTDISGDTLWTKAHMRGTILATQDPYSIQPTGDGGYIIAANIDYLGPRPSNVDLIKTDANGDTLWTKTYGGAGSDRGYSVQQTTDGGYIIAGYTLSFGAGSGDVYLIKTDSLGNTITNNISGSLFIDYDLNCLIDTSDRRLKEWVVKMTPGTRGNPADYASTNSNGYYNFLTDTGDYEITLITENPYLEVNCPSTGSYTISFDSIYQTSDSNNFALEAIIDCPLMTVDIASGLTRPCRSKTYTVEYCNHGAIDAQDASVDVTFDELLTPTSSTLAWSSVSGNTYTFDLGTVAVGDCNTFYITTDVSCDAEMNQTLCAAAYIYPDTICTPIDSTWDKSSIAVTGVCEGDSICFTITNTGEGGEGDMAGASQWRLYANDTLVAQDDFQINGQETMELCFAANGKTLRLEADQRPGHPGYSRPRETVEGCGTNSAGTVDYGYYLNTPQDDEDPFKEIDCQVVRAAYDPNDKQVQPKGITSNKYIKAEDQLEYQIRFQNTGNDTAFLIVVRDTLDTQTLDIATMQSGASSHPYTFRIYGQGILEWTFNNILLPDSNTNEPESHGFVKFKVDQQPNNPEGTLIENHVGIYFDFNAPVLTNTAWNVVWDTTLVSSIESTVYSSQTTVKVYPNPFSNTTTFIIDHPQIRSGKVEIEVYDLLGKKVKSEQVKSMKHELNRKGLPEGIYLYQIKAEGALIGSGKLVVQ